jgi:hypothetical protein
LVTPLKVAGGGLPGEPALIVPFFGYPAVVDIARFSPVLNIPLRSWWPLER